MTNVAPSTATSQANLSEQTQRDLESILETLDQRIHEISGASGATAELKALEALRGSTAGVLRVG